MELIRIPRDNRPDLEFEGVLLSLASSEKEGSCRWTEYRLYRTAGGHYVAAVLGPSTLPGERTFGEAEVCETEEQVREFFGGSGLARDIYNALGWSAPVERVP